MAAHAFVIAEAGVNHNGSLDLALQLIDVAAAAGADAVKFQTFNADDLVTRDAPKAAYQQRNMDGGASSSSQYDMLRRLQLDRAAHDALRRHCAEQGVEFMSTAFDLRSLDLLCEVGIKRLKVGSGEITNGPLLLAMARRHVPVILSTGMSTLEEIHAALGVLAFGFIGTAEKPSEAAFDAAFTAAEGQAALARLVTILHCTTEYPAPYEDVNLRALDTLRESFGCSVGLSDHSPGIAIPIAAVARGASTIEKHFTLDRALPGPDHAASLTPQELRDMIAGIRAVEAAIGDGQKVPRPSEVANIRIARRSLVAARPIRAGEVLGEDALAVKRPGGGVSPMRYWDRLDRPAERSYAADEMIE
ncbi:MAG TPA: N-acetylneuraminate synthase [Stellaceae bacterium]|jgi:N-acetylneuraminate synthase